jgi:acetyltransferase-like isoleucine patch superfamily enzyme
LIRRAAQKGVAAMLRLAAPDVDVFDIGERLSVGRYSYGKPKVRWYEGDRASVHIGAFCSIADDVVVTVGGGHPLDWPSMYPFRAKLGLPEAYADGLPVLESDVVIGNDVWIGRGARILAGTRIGHGAAIGAYSVVTREVRPYAVVAGNPAREVRRRFSDDEVEAMLEIAWWDWPDEKVRENIASLNRANVAEFIDRFR